MTTFKIDNLWRHGGVLVDLSRNKVQSVITYEIGDGGNSSLWLYNWHLKVLYMEEEICMTMPYLERRRWMIL